jgi:hypothetical protein
MSFPFSPRSHAPPTRLIWGLAAVVYSLSLMTYGQWVVAADLDNPTGLPVYPNVEGARLEDRLTTDDLGRWCMRLSARSWDSLATVENWYRHALSNASETDLLHDGDYERRYLELDGIKLTKNLAFVAVYKASKGAATSIDIVRCGTVR